MIQWFLKGKGFMIRAVFFDIDGTLIDHEHGSVVPDSTLASLAALHRKGVKVFVATGRAPSVLAGVREIFPFDGFVTLNGQLVQDRENRVLHRKAHHPESIRALLPLVHKENIPCLIIEEEESFPVANGPKIEWYFSLIDQPVSPLYDLDRLENHSVLQFLAFMPWEERDRLAPIPGIEPTSSGGDILDVIPEKGGKEVGIAAAAAHYGFSRENVMVFGDGPNDIRMIRWAGTGVAMGNGGETVKAAADYVTSPVGENGVKNALLHFGVLSPSDFED